MGIISIYGFFISLLGILVSNQPIPEMFVVSASLDIKQLALECNDDYYFKILSNGELDYHFPPSGAICNAINGSLSFDGYNSSYFDFIPKSLLNVRKIIGSLEIKKSNVFPPLQYLNEVGSIYISMNEYNETWMLRSIKSIKNMLDISGWDRIKLSLPNLVDLGNLNIDSTTIILLDMHQLQKVGSVSIINSLLDDLTCIQNIKRISSDLNIVASTIITVSLHKITSIGGSLIFSRNLFEAAVFIFPYGIKIGGDLIMNYNRFAKIKFKTLRGSTKIIGSLQLLSNEGFVDLAGLKSVQIANSIDISYNLKPINMFKVSNLSKLSGNIIIRDNNEFQYPVFKSLWFIGGDFALPQLTTPNDKFIPGFPKLTRVNGKLIVNQLQSITDMEVVKLLGFFKSLEITNNENLLNLDGLEQLTILDSLEINGNRNLESLKALNNYFALAGTLSILNNPKLTALEGLENIKNLGSLSIQANNNLKSLKQLSSLGDVSEFLKIDGNDNLYSLDGLNNVNHLGGLSIIGNINIQSLKGLDSLTTVDRELSIQFCNLLSSTEGLRNLNTVGSLYFDSNFALESVKELDNLVNFQGRVSFYFNAKLESLEGLNNFKHISSLALGFNGIQSLKELSNLEFIDGELSILSNQKITSLEGLDNIKELGSLSIDSNENLVSLEGLTQLAKVGSIYIDFRYQQRIAKLKLGKEGSNLGYPRLLIKNYKMANSLSVDDIVLFVTPLCNNNINISEEDITCNQSSA